MGLEALHEMIAELSARWATTPVGAVGKPAGTTDVEGLLLEELPFALNAMTDTVYEVPLVRPVIVHVRVAAPEVEQTLAPGVVVAV